MVKQVVKSKIEMFKKHFSAGLKNMQEACEVYVECIDENIENKQKFIDSLPEIPSGAWVTFELIGRKQIHKKLIYGGGKAQAELRRLPYSCQEDVLENGVELLLKNNDTMKILPENMTKDQVKQCFDKGAIRDLAAQKAFIESKKTYIQDPIECEKVYTTGKNKVSILKPVILDRRDLIQMLGEIS